jgi:hypothetical protein
MLFIIYAYGVKDFRRFETLNLEGCREKLTVIYLKAHSLRMDGENQKNLKYCRGICGFKVCDLLLMNTFIDIWIYGYILYNVPQYTYVYYYCVRIK